ncbi:MAG: PDZ domain-containing protein [Planctomycetota bacterium]
MRRPFAALLLLVSLGGCHIVGKDSYWDDFKSQNLDGEPEGLTEERANFPFLGVRLPERAGDLELGARILHVFRSSPAARGGLEVNDEVRSIGGAPVRTADDVRAALRGVSPVTSLVYAREGQEHEIRISLVRWADYMKERRRRIFSEAAYAGLSLPFFFNYVTRELTPEFVMAYYGAKVDEPVIVYEDFDLFPLWYSGISVWRRETLIVWDSSRSQVISWPMRVTTDGSERTVDLNDVIPPLPKGTKDL